MNVLRWPAGPDWKDRHVNRSARQRRAHRLEYRLDSADDAAAWRIIDVNAGGPWVVQSYRSQFARELAKGGVDGLIAALVERNNAASKN